MDLATAADELYGLAPEEFTAARTRLAAEAKRDGDPVLAKQVTALRRPTVSAWAVNHLVRASPPELDDLLDLGERLRSAWEAGEPVAGLDQRRAGLVTALMRTASALAASAGRPLREPAAREAEDTLYAATMDPVVSDEVRAGHLSRPRRHVGFAPAAPARAPEPRQEKKTPAKAPRPSAEDRRTREEDRRAREEERRRRRREERARAAEAEADAAAEALAEWSAERDEARRECAEVTEEAGRLRERLRETLARQESLTRRLETAEREHTRAERRAAEARRQAQEARDLV
ncbi:hypothetical protein GCM10009677_33600 [Sphaerisporangium rubeum]|uniref:Uncharacterized protein n=1 Tax=Sphaerisporangium rubeum TaxID=321317 RepID=A0A7X0M7K2_9ACTN|nr:hypothetical protein [Sphaerisporangium rubeum]MBB6474888.1 hypothetical protein [Sphaerisporangium rubeum]